MSAPAEANVMTSDIAAAAVLVSWDPSTLVPYQAPELAPPVPGLLEKVSIPLRSGRRQLRDDVRIRVLSQLGRGGALAARAVATPAARDAVQDLFDALVGGTAGELSTWSDTWLAVAPRVVGWLVKIGDLVLPSVLALEHARDRAQLLRPLRETADRLRGRAAAGKEIRGFVETSEPGAPLLVRGVGGSGKSTLVARAFVDHIDAGGRGAYVDFDAPAMDFGAAAAVDEGLESVGPHPYEALLVAEIARQFGALDTDTSFYLYSRDVHDAHRLGELLAFRDGPNPLLVLDTLEELQYAGPFAVDLLRALLWRLQKLAPALRVVLSGRAPVPEVTPRELPVSDLEPAVAAEVFRELVEKHQGRVTEAQSAAVLKRVGTFPLHVVIAAYAVSEEPALIDEVETRKLEGEVAAGFLYRRILQHIHDEALRPIAEAALALRRVDLGVIESVLVEPGREVDAPRLLEELGREVALARPIEGGVAFRQEIRSMVLPRLKEDRSGQWADLHRGAAALWAQRREEAPPHSSAELQARAEELYHRLVLWEDPEAIEALWRPECASYLVDAAVEPVLTGAAQEFLVWRTADVDGGATPGLSRARELLRVLGAAEACLEESAPEQAATLLAQGGALDDARGMLLLAKARQALGDEEGAISWAGRAASAAGRTGDAVVAHDALLLEVTWRPEAEKELALARLEQGLATERAPIRRLRLLNLRAALVGASEEQVAEGARLCAEVGAHVVARDPELLRGLIDWVPDDALLVAAVERFGLDHVSEEDREALLAEVAKWESSRGLGVGLESMASEGGVSSAELHRLFLELFSGAELRRFLSEVGEDILWALPGEMASLDELAAGAVSQLGNRGLINEGLRRALLRVRPRRAPDINAVFALQATRASGANLAKTLVALAGHRGPLPIALAERLRRVLQAPATTDATTDALLDALKLALPEARIRGEVFAELGLGGATPDPVGAEKTAHQLVEAARRSARVLDLVRATTRRALAFAEVLEIAYLEDLARRFEALLHLESGATRVVAAELEEVVARGVGSRPVSGAEVPAALIRSLWARPLPALRPTIARLLQSASQLDETARALLYLTGVHDPRWGLAELDRRRVHPSSQAPDLFREMRREFLGVLARSSPEPERSRLLGEMDDLRVDETAWSQRIARSPDAGFDFLASQPSTPDLVRVVRRLEAVHGLDETDVRLGLLRSELARRTFELPLARGTVADHWLASASEAARLVVSVGTSRYGPSTPGVLLDSEWFGAAEGGRVVLARLPRGTSDAFGPVITQWDGARKPTATAWRPRRWRAIPAPSGPGMPEAELVLFDGLDALLNTPLPRPGAVGTARVRIGPDTGGGPPTRLALGTSATPFFRGPAAPGCCPIFDEEWNLAGIHLGSGADGFSSLWTVEELIERFRPA